MSFNGQLFQEHRHRKLLKSDNSSSSYDRKCQRRFPKHSVSPYRGLAMAEI